MYFLKLETNDTQINFFKDPKSSTKETAVRNVGSTLPKILTSQISVNTLPCPYLNDMSAL